MTRIPVLMEVTTGYIENNLGKQTFKELRGKTRIDPRKIYRVDEHVTDDFVYCIVFLSTQSGEDDWLTIPGSYTRLMQTIQAWESEQLDD